MMNQNGNSEPERQTATQRSRQKSKSGNLDISSNLDEVARYVIEGKICRKIEAQSNGSEKQTRQ